MIVKAKNQKQGFTLINNAILHDKRLSLKALGVYLQLISKDQDEWKFSVNGISGLVADGERSVSNAMRELEECGYLKRIPNREGGKYTKYEYYIYEEPFKHEDTVNIPSKDEFMEWCIQNVDSGVSWDIEYDRLVSNEWKDSKGNPIHNWKHYCKALE